MYDLDTFKEALEAYIGNNLDCTRNKNFLVNHKINIPKNFILMQSEYAAGRLHFWWNLDKKIYDPTMAQFKTINKDTCDSSFIIYYSAMLTIFDQIEYKSYDQSVTNEAINDELIKLYKNPIYVKLFASRY